MVRKPDLNLRSKATTVADHDDRGPDVPTALDGPDRLKPHLSGSLHVRHGAVAGAWSHSVGGMVAGSRWYADQRADV